MESLLPCLVAALCAALVMSSSSSAAAAAAVVSPYEALQAHGLPAGLLPQGVSEFRVDVEGRFDARLPSPCTAAKLDTAVQYAANVSGTLSYGRIAELSGVAAQDLFLWFPVHGIRVDVPSSGLIYFDVGVVHKQFSLSMFESPPECHPIQALATSFNLRSLV